MSIIKNEIGGSEPEISTGFVEQSALTVVLERVRQQDIATRVRPNLDKVYAFLRSHGDLRLPGAHNAFLYRHHLGHEPDGKMHVEFGVQVRGAFEQTGDVFAGATPAGRIAKARRTSGRTSRSAKRVARSSAGAKPRKNPRRDRMGGLRRLDRRPDEARDHRVLSSRGARRAPREAEARR
jgi:hypothetical protein